MGPELPPPRRVVLADGADGRTRVVADGPAPRPGRLASIWSCEATPPLPSDGAEPGLADTFPPPGGFRFMVVDLSPDVDKPPSTDERYAGFHRTDSYDCGVVVSGSVILELDDGEVELHAGDTFVQCGGNHAWRNPNPEPCRVAFVLIGADRSE
ncbi:MAG: cupin domain-containing protein [Acidimicrobiales bacterium]|nr:cupin domain-containing protein [Acidimicrobiales bacterium]